MATLGPASHEEAVLEQMLLLGVDIVRLNLSHGSHDSHRKIIRRVRKLADQQQRFIPIVLDLMGPRYRLGEISDGPKTLTEGETVTLGRDGEGADIPIGDAQLLDYLQPKERVLIDNGLIEVEIETTTGSGGTARVVHGGRISSRKGINLPDSNLPFTISEKDRADIAFAVAERVDFIAGSYVGSGEDLRALKREMDACGERLPLIAKLERSSVLNRLDEIFDEAEAVMVARGDLGVEIPLHRVPVIQKEIIAASRRRGKPVIVATQMLESMIQQPRPTRAEASDVANAVFDGADALMLSGETAAGAFPVEAIRTMHQIIEQAELHRFHEQEGADLAPPPELGLTRAPIDPEQPWSGRDPLEIAEVVSAAGVYAASRLGIRTIVAFSQGGFTARMIARNRPQAPILVFTTDYRVARRIQLVWGTRPRLMPREVHHHDEVVEVVESELIESGLAEPGECIVILMGEPIREQPLTNLVRLVRIAGEKTHDASTSPGQSPGGSNSEPSGTG